MKQYLRICHFGFVLSCFASATAAEWRAVHDTYILSDKTREISCRISHPRQQTHLYKVQLIYIENHRHQERTALIVYRHEQFTVIEGTTAYQLFRAQCGLPAIYKWFP